MSQEVEINDGEHVLVLLSIMSACVVVFFVYKLKWWFF